MTQQKQIDAECPAICPCCEKVTEYTDQDSYNDPNLMAECDHCGCEFALYYADFVIERDDNDASN